MERFAKMKKSMDKDKKNGQHANDENVTPGAPESPQDNESGGDDQEKNEVNGSHITAEDRAGEPQEENDATAFVEASQEALQSAEEQNKWLRAEFANYKISVERKQQETVTYIKGDIIKELLPIVDDFKILVDTSESNEKKAGISQGAKMIYEKLLNILEKQGLVKIEALGETFDPNIHEALMMRPTNDKDAHEKVIEVFQDGFTLHEKLIRPTKVVVGQYEE